MLEQINLNKKYNTNNLFIIKLSVLTKTNDGNSIAFIYVPKKYIIAEKLDEENYKDIITDKKYNTNEIGLNGSMVILPSLIKSFKDYEINKSSITVKYAIDILEFLGEKPLEKEKNKARFRKNK